MKIIFSCTSLLMLFNKFRDSDRCFRTNGFYGKSNYFTFIGDSRVRQLYLQLRELLGTENLTATIDNVSWFILKINNSNPICVFIHIPKYTVYIKLKHNIVTNSQGREWLKNLRWYCLAKSQTEFKGQLFLEPSDWL